MWYLRWGKNIQHSMLALMRQAVYGRIAGYEDTNDADYLRVDPAMRRMVGGRAEKKLGAYERDGPVRDGVSADREEPGGRCHLCAAPGSIGSTGELSQATWYWTRAAQRAPRTGARKAGPSMATSDAPATTPCSASTT